MEKQCHSNAPPLQQYEPTFPTGRVSATSVSSSGHRHCLLWQTCFLFLWEQSQCVGIHKIFISNENQLTLSSSYTSIFLLIIFSLFLSPACDPQISLSTSCWRKSWLLKQSGGEGSEEWGTGVSFAKVFQLQWQKDRHATEGMTLPLVFINCYLRLSNE